MAIHNNVFTRRVRAGRRTYFFDVKDTKAGDDFFLIVTESKEVGEGRYEKFRVRLYKEDFDKFCDAMDEAIDFIKQKLGME